MGTNLPIHFSDVASNVIATYDFFDIEEGTGIVQFKAAIWEDSNGKNSLLTVKDLFSRLVESNGTINNHIDFQDKITKNFDLADFQFPKIIEGDCVIEFSMAGKRVGTSAIHVRAKINVQHYDGTTATDIATVTSPTLTTDSTTGSTSLISIKLALPRTTFKKGENLRLKIVIQGRQAIINVADDKVYMGHDPQNRDGSVITPSSSGGITKCNFYCPFRLDL